LMVNGRKVGYLRNSRYEADRARTLLTRAYGQDVPVSAAIVFVGAKGFTLRGGGPPDLAVLRNAAALRGWLRSRPVVLTPDQVTALYELARRPSTWR
jgi:outer membrane biogenesis lipoprotein LolB